MKTILVSEATQEANARNEAIYRKLCANAAKGREALAKKVAERRAREALEAEARRREAHRLVEATRIPEGGTSQTGKTYAPLHVVQKDATFPRPNCALDYSMNNHLDLVQYIVVECVTYFRENGGIHDLEKARDALNMLIEMERGRE